jgi:hypothetical protein
VSEHQLYDDATVPDFTTPEWYAERESAPHLDQPLHQGRLKIAARYAIESGCRTAVDLGAGDGGLLSLIAPEFDRVWGYDLQPSNVEAAKARGVDVRYGDITEAIEWAGLAICTETLEHLLDPHGLLHRARDYCEQLVASSPYTETPESHYGFHTFCWDVDGYVDMIERAGWRVVEMSVTDIFQVIRAT